MDLIKTIHNFQGYIDSRRGGRPENQDHYDYKDTPHGLIVVVCDGMGGGPSGKLASTIAVQRTIDYVMQANDNEAKDTILKDAVTYAHKAILLRQQNDSTTRGMGTTLTALLINSKSAYIAHVGDSRVYQFRKGKVVFKTKDHSYVGELVQKGELSEEQARLSTRSNIITRCLGGKSMELADIDGPLPYKKGDRFMLCTDGIWGAVPEPELDEGNRHDNLTLALLETTEDSQLQEPMSRTAQISITVLSILLAISLIFGFNQCKKAKRYTEALQQIETLKKELRQDKDSINFLKGRIKGSQEKGHDVNVYVTDGTGKNEKVDEKDETKVYSPDQVTSILDQIISQLNQAKDMNENDTRARIRKTVIEQLDRLAQKDPTNKVEYDRAAAELKKPKSTKTGNEGKGQYEAIIKILNKAKK